MTSVPHTPPLPPTPTAGTLRPTVSDVAPRMPAPSIDLLAQANERTEVSRADVPLVTHERVRLIEGSVSDLRDAVGGIKNELRANTKTTSKGASWSQFAAIGGPILLALLSAMGEWGNQHPEAKVGLVGVFLTVAGAFARSRAASASSAAAATAGDVPPPPPAHS